MDITDVRIRKLNPNNASDSKMRAIVSVTLNDEFVVHDIKVIQGTEKLFIAMPSRKVEDGTYKDITHPIKSGFRDKLQDAVMARYERALVEEAGRNVFSGSGEDAGNREWEGARQQGGFKES